MDIGLRVRITNEEAAKSFKQAHDQLQWLVQDQPWNQELQHILTLMQEARAGLGVDHSRR